ncbi:phosphotriesterase family protein [Sphaerimonospora thailandensis]|uniref:Aryldialkylphosphatase n=1 Tax=Sphaerimonospora thailandensis TaxID=795644 RepID=A0A8J3RDM0_9ACTN|nr:aryldialkylphosphatase [Sphaerimonospora thailandensis]GIH72720.1 aryldialkylphosphatase [Sphaerimonospora thailandensis]
MSGASFPRIQTVTGAVPVSELDGPVLPHEHMRTDTRWGVGVESDPRRWLDEERHIIPEIRVLGREHGLTLIVEHSCLGMARDPAALARVSMDTRVHVVTATGFAAEPFSGHLIRHRDVDDLTGDLLREIGAGLDGTGARPGLIVAASWDEIPTPAEERAVIAAARASLHADLPVAAESLELLELLLSNGVPARRLSIRGADAPAQRKIAETGAYVSVREAEQVLALLDAGHAERVLLSSGVERQEHVAAYGGHGYARLFDTLIPALSGAGVDNDTLHLMMCENPLRWLTDAG